MNVVEGLETLPRAVELVRLLFSAIFVEADTSAETENLCFRGTYMICHYTVMYFVVAWALRLIISALSPNYLFLSVEITELEKRTDKSVQSFL